MLLTIRSTYVVKYTKTAIEFLQILSCPIIFFLLWWRMAFPGRVSVVVVIVVVALVVGAVVLTDAPKKYFKTHSLSIARML